MKDEDFALDIPEEAKVPIMEQRRYTTTAWRQLGIRGPRLLTARRQAARRGRRRERSHVTDPDLAVWRDDIRKQKLNAAIFF